VSRASKPSTAEFLRFAHELADLSATAVLPYFRRSLRVTNKTAGAGFDPVTAADKAAERAIRAAIAKRFPDHGILGEEFAAVEGSGRHRWVIDPIDGTRAFIMGSPLWGTLIGLLDGRKPVLGIMDQPFTRERFWGDGRTAHMRGPDGRSRRIRTRGGRGLAEAVVTSTDPDMFAGPPERAAFARVKARVRMTRFGGDCYGYCLLAAGFTDVVIEVGLKPHDIVALIPIIEGAGGRVSTWEGGPALDGGRIVAAASARVHGEVLELLRA
jgi:myo-inositol-1(or 4)-monophosphatase